MIEGGAVILSGGQNSRMKTNKAFLEIKAKKIIESTVEKLRPLFQEVLVVTNEPELYRYLGINIVTDEIPGMGPLSGIHAGLKGASYSYNLIVACDMPFINPQLALQMLREAPGWDVVVPRIGQHLQPLYGIYAKTCIPFVEDCLKQKVGKVIAFYPQVRVKYLDEATILQYTNGKDVFFNVNTPEDLALARKME